MRMTRADSVGGYLGQPLGRGRGREEGTTERVGGGGVGVVRESRGLKYLYLYALLFASSSPRSVPPYYCYLEIPPPNDVLHLN